MENLIAVGIDVSKGKSMISVMRQMNDVVITQFNVNHNKVELKALVKR